MEHIIKQYKTNPDLVFNTWFIENEDRLKAFRSIRRGVLQVIKDIQENTFPNDFKKSSLEFVLTCITEQKQVFEGASHPFYWKPKLRIPDIYENQENKRLFGQFLENCVRATKEAQILDEIIKLDQKKIKGLGPAVANILYFLHPTLMTPFNTAMVNGFNTLFNEKVKLGSWSEYLRMREVIIQQNKRYKQLLSNDLGAFSGLLFEIGMKNILIGNESGLTEEERVKILKRLEKRQKKVVDEKEEGQLHSEMQYRLLKIGNALNYDVIAASNDRSKSHDGNKFSFMGLSDFPCMDIAKETLNTIKLIDIVWFEKNTNKIVCAFEVEKSTSIYSGILRLSDLSYSFPNQSSKLYIVIPDKREKEVKFQLSRPSIANGKIEIQYILFSELREHCNALCKFGDSHHILEKISRKV
ncbi:Putative type II restriction enzyme NmeDIP (Endonuclease NmeDIP) (R.NmeDIP) [hydrothermal vent metagenome]|uniref:Type II restriction enzyme NmeDIP (Endonuclease NmeDIP) (R.NmeDIP) n=1 Tax=hydrothermal vent metagenome TaxID=652676 RepID=A0A3B0U8M7_9ZZZZ